MLTSAFLTWQFALAAALPANACELPSVQQVPTKTSILVNGAVGAKYSFDRASIVRHASASADVDQPSTAGPIRGRFEGVLLSDLLKAASPIIPPRKNSLIGFVVVARATDGYEIAVSYAEADPAVTRTPALVAFSCNGRPISPTLVLPGNHDSSRYVHELGGLTLLDAGSLAR